MDMLADVLIFCHKLYDLIREILRIGRRKADTQFRTDLSHHFEKLSKVHILFPALPMVRIHILTKQGHLFIALGKAVTGLAYNGMGIPAALRTPGIRDNALRAYIVAASHYGDVCRYSVLVDAPRVDIGVSLFT